MKTISKDDCMLYAGHISNNGYGRMYNSDLKKMISAHRFVYIALKGQIPPGLEIDHLCRVPRCININHMELVTHKENMQRIYGAELCKRGHELTPNNIYFGLKNKKTNRYGREKEYWV